MCLPLATLLVSGRARAGGDEAALHTRSYRLTWTGPQSCPTQGEVAARIDRMLEGSKLDQPPDLDAVAAVTATANGSFSAELEYAVAGAKNQRTLDAMSCETLAAATALIIAIAIDPIAAERAARLTDHPERPHSLAPEPAAAPIRDAPPPAAPAGPVALDKAGFVAMMAWAGLDVMPHLDWGVGILVGFNIGRLSIAAEGQYWGSQRQPSDERSSAGADFERYSGGLRGCYRITGAQLTLDACGGAEVMRLSGHGYGVTNKKSGSQTWLEPLLGSAIGYQITPAISVVWRAELVFPGKRHDFVLEGIGPVYRLPPVGERAGLGLSAAF